MRFLRLFMVAACAVFIAAAPGGVRASSVQDRADELEIAALDLDAKGDLDNAIAKHREALKLVPKNKAFKENAAATLYKAAVARHEAKDDAGAIAYLEEALALVPSFKPAQQSLALLKTNKLNSEGVALLKAANYQGAVEKFNAVLAVDPDNAAAKINRDVAESQIAMAAGDPATAVAKLQEAVSLDSTRQFLKDKLAEAQAALDAKNAEAKKAEDAKPKK